jgi:iron complex outermembrane receptor protein
VSAQAFDRAARTRVDDQPGHDDWSLARASARWETTTRRGGQLLLDAAAYDGEMGGDLYLWETYPTDFGLRTTKGSVSGGHALAEWSRPRASGSQLTVRAFYDLTRRDETIIREDRSTWDVELQSQHPLGERHALMWGLGARGSHAEYRGSPTATLTPSSRTDDRWSGFVQDEIQLVRDAWRLVVGSKFEHNDYTGFEVQPNVRLAWNPAPARVYWAAVSRAVRIPAAALSYGKLNHFPIDTGSSMPGNLRLRGNPDLESENVLALEAGFRTRLSDGLLIDVAAFHNEYDDVGLLMPSEPFVESVPEPPHLVLPFTAMNAGSLTTQGFELAADARLGEHWRLLAGYSYLDHNRETDGSAFSGMDIITVGNPRHQAFARATASWENGLELDVIGRFVDEIEGIGTKAVSTVDVRVGYRPRPGWELALVGRNLVDDDRIEFFDLLLAGPPTRVPRSLHGVITRSF